jgi:hypothetical protein
MFFRPTIVFLLFLESGELDACHLTFYQNGASSIPFSLTLDNHFARCGLFGELYMNFHTRLARCRPFCGLCMNFHTRLARCRPVW